MGASTLTAICQIRAVAAFAGLKLDLPEGYVHFEDNKKPEFLAKFPHGKIPAFEGADGFKLTETSAIARYSESSSRSVCDFHPGGLFQRSKREDEIYIISYPCLNFCVDSLTLTDLLAPSARS